MFTTSHAFKNDSWPPKIRPFSSWPPINEMANIFSGSAYGKLIISHSLFIVEQQIWYQIEAKLLSFCTEFKYAN